MKDLDYLDGIWDPWWVRKGTENRLGRTPDLWESLEPGRAGLGSASG